MRKKKAQGMKFPSILLAANKAQQQKLQTEARRKYIGNHAWN